eukprot:1138475-Pelagomonas_calceolata.AAC.5
MAEAVCVCARERVCYITAASTAENGANDTLCREAVRPPAVGAVGVVDGAAGVDADHSPHDSMRAAAMGVQVVQDCKLWGYELYGGVTPDIMTLAKPLAGGLPIGAVLMKQHVADAMKPGGGPVWVDRVQGPAKSGLEHGPFDKDVVAHEPLAAAFEPNIVVGSLVPS